MRKCALRYFYIPGTTLAWTTDPCNEVFDNDGDKWAKDRMEIYWL
ncbi:MAG: hypothetical protein UW39_C0008G0049 [Parcubacteria group bacterium GW2011_GWC2_44_17]|nr:MAG: hypothetical protein UW39_C0008G0049 [Parcubacteria group bacterium GW2011_GWC2_44_17]KKT50495.1 MAG: hypothetical protein UW40_C0003G0018 [Parcubacteria group bacterium GW2011_GWF2_44_17]